MDKTQSPGYRFSSELHERGSHDTEYLLNADTVFRNQIEQNIQSKQCNRNPS